MSSAAAAAIDKRPRRNSNKPSPLDAAVVAASNAAEGGLKSPMTPNRRAVKRDEGPPRSAPPLGSPIDALAAAAIAAVAAATPKTPVAAVAAAAKTSTAAAAAGSKTSATAVVATPKTTATETTGTAKATTAETKTQQTPSTSRQIPPNLNLSNPATPTTPNPALRSPRPPIKSAHFDALEAEGERDAMVRTLVFQLQKEMQDEIDRLTTVHRKALEEKSSEFQALAELLAKKREEWSLQMAAKTTIIADQQFDIVGFVKKNNESTMRIRSLEGDLERERGENEKLRAQLSEFALPCSSKSVSKPKDQPIEEDLIIVSNKDSDGFEKPSTNTRKTLKRPATDN